MNEENSSPGQGGKCSHGIPTRGYCAICYGHKKEADHTQSVERGDPFPSEATKRMSKTLGVPFISHTDSAEVIQADRIMAEREGVLHEALRLIVSKGSRPGIGVTRDIAARALAAIQAIPAPATDAHEGWRTMAIETAARDARDRMLGLIDSGEKLTERAKAVLERAAEDIRLAVNLPSASLPKSPSAGEEA